MSIRKILYPLDFSGTATSNRIEGELRTIGTDRYRAFTLNFAPFYTSNLTIKERGKTKLLVRGTDYECLYFYPELTKLAAGKEICGVVVITNANIGTELVVGYNTVGGHYAHSADVIQMAIEALELDNRNVYWQDVIDKPDLFQPTPHLHDIGDVYGLEFHIDVLVAIRDAILIGDNEVHQQIYDRIDDIVNQLTTQLNAHRSDYYNPHKTTAHQVNAYTREEVDAQIQSIMEDLADLEPRFQAITTKFTETTQHFSAIESALLALTDRVGVVELEHSKFYTLLSTINQTLDQHQSLIDDLEAEIVRLDGVDSNLQTQINALKTRATNIENKNVEQDDRLDDIESLNVTQNTRLANVETKNTQQDNRLTALETLTTNHTNSILGVVNVNNTQNTRLTALENTNATQNTRISDLENNPAVSTYVRSGISVQDGYDPSYPEGTVRNVGTIRIAASTKTRQLTIKSLHFSQYNHKYDEHRMRLDVRLNGTVTWSWDIRDGEAINTDLVVNLSTNAYTLEFIVYVTLRGMRQLNFSVSSFKLETFQWGGQFTN